MKDHRNYARMDGKLNAKDRLGTRLFAVKHPDRSYTDIGEAFGVSGETVRRHVVDFGLERTGNPFDRKTIGIVKPLYRTEAKINRISNKDFEVLCKRCLQRAEYRVRDADRRREAAVAVKADENDLAKVIKELVSANGSIEIPDPLPYSADGMKGIIDLLSADPNAIEGAQKKDEAREGADKDGEPDGRLIDLGGIRYKVRPKPGVTINDDEWPVPAAYLR